MLTSSIDFVLWHVSRSDKDPSAIEASPEKESLNAIQSEQHSRSLDDFQDVLAEGNGGNVRDSDPV